MGGRLVLNADAFFYDYKGYQVSKIVNESSVNENINAHIYGVEFEGIYEPIRHLTFNTNFGYLHTEITGGQSVDELNLTQGDPTLTLAKGTNGSNCVVNTAALAGYLAAVGNANPAALTYLCSGTAGNVGGALPVQAFAGLYNYGASGSTVFAVNGTNVGQGVNVNLKGKELPNSPEFTVSFGAQYVYDLPQDWRATLRGDYYFQDSSYARIYNATNDYLKSWNNVNATLSFDQADWKLNVQFFVKNLFDKQPFTDTYVTDPTSALFTNTFTLDPRTYGVSVTKRF